jgi:GNAT superfamily N-acetyltransferase
MSEQVIVERIPASQIGLRSLEVARVVFDAFANFKPCTEEGAWETVDWLASLHADFFLATVPTEPYAVGVGMVVEFSKTLLAGYYLELGELGAKPGDIFFTMDGVLPTHRRLGIHSALIRARIGACSDRTLWTRVDKENRASLESYARFPFVEVGAEISRGGKPFHSKVFRLA